MSRRQFAAYLLTGFVLLAIIDMIVHPGGHTPESISGLITLMFLAVFVHPKETRR